MNIFFGRTPLLGLSILVVLLSGCETLPSSRADEASTASQEVVAEQKPSVERPSKPSPQQSMDRLMRELEGKPPLPSDTQGASSSSEGANEGARSAAEFLSGDAEDRSSVGGCDHPTLPQWVRQRSPLAGVGGPSSSREGAEAHAKVDVVKQLELSITGEDTFVEQESTGGEFQYDVRSTVVERVNIRLTGLGITKVFQDPCDHQFYALAILDRSMAENGWRTDLSALDSQADAFRNHIATHTQKGEAFSLLLAQYRLMEVAETGCQLERRLAYLTGVQASGLSCAGMVKQSLNAYESLLGSLQVKTSGDGQQAVDGPALPNPLMVQVLAGDTPVSRVPVQFTVTQGQIDVPHTAWTDAQGNAQVVARYSVETEEPARIEAHVLLEQVTHEYPEVLKQQVLKRHPQFTARFQVLPPVYHLMDTLNDLGKDAKVFHTKADDLLARGESLRAMVPLHQLMEVQNMWVKNADRLGSLSPDTPLPQAGIGDADSTNEQLEALINALRIEVAGNRQQAIAGPHLPEPLVVRVLAGDRPVSQVPVTFQAEGGSVEVEAGFETNAQGEARAKVHHREGQDAGTVVVARVALEQFLHDAPSILQERLRQRSEELTTRFVVLPPVYHLLTHSQQLAGEGDTLHSKIQTAHIEGDVFLLMDALSELHVVQTEWDQVVERLRDRHPASAESAKSPGDADDTLHDLERLVSSFEFRVVKGNEQHAVLGRPLKDSLEAQLVAHMAGKEVAVSQVPVTFEFDQGKGDVDSHVSTSLDGHVHAIVHRVEPAAGKNDTEAIVLVRLDVDNLGQSLPATFRERLHKHLHEQVLRFRIIPPRGCVSMSPFDGPLYELACDLVKQVNISVGKPTIVRGFVERGTRQRHPLSARIEEALEAGLTLTQQLQVLHLADSANASTSFNGAVEVSGVYEQYREGLLVKAELIRLADHVTEAASETTIPRAALPKTGLSPLSLPGSSTSDLPLVPAHSEYSTHDEWVTAFWQHHNPQATFQTWIKPEEPDYREHEHATFSFKTEQDCYLWVFNIGASGTGAVLLPNKLRPDPRHILIRDSDGWVSIPSPGEQFNLSIGPPFGIERVKTLCTTRPVAMLPSHVFQSLQLPYFEFSRNNQRFRDVGVAHAGRVALKPSEWSEAHTKVKTLPKGQHETQGMRGLRGLGLDQTKR
jgi:hypothetical protein